MAEEFEAVAVRQGYVAQYQMARLIVNERHGLAMVGGFCALVAEATHDLVADDFSEVLVVFDYEYIGHRLRALKMRGVVKYWG